MATKKLKEDEARKLREDARKFLEIHQCGPRDPNSRVAALGRDNTFEQLRELKRTQAETSVPKPVSAAATEVPKTALIDQPALPDNWRVDGVFFVHETTGCAIRTNDPRAVKGGIQSFKPLPSGWKLIRNPKSNEDDAPVFYWNPLSMITSWAFPAVEETHVFHPNPSGELEVPPVAVVVDSDTSTCIINSNDSIEAVETPQPAAVLFRVQPTSIKRAKPSSVFMTE